MRRGGGSGWQGSATFGANPSFADARIMAYMEETSSTTAESFMCVDHLRVDDRFMGPPAGFFRAPSL